MERRFYKTDMTYNINQVQGKEGLYAYDKADFFIDHFDKTTAWVILSRKRMVGNRVKEQAIVHPLCGELEIRNMLKSIIDNRDCPKENIHMHDIDAATVYMEDKYSDKGYLELHYTENILKEKVRRVYHLPKSCGSSLSQIVMPYRNTDPRTTEPFTGYGESDNLKNKNRHWGNIILKTVFAQPYILKKGYTIRGGTSAISMDMISPYEIDETSQKTF